jgi:hypothetical protein
MKQNEKKVQRSKFYVLGLKKRWMVSQAPRSWDTTDIFDILRLWRDNSPYASYCQLGSLLRFGDNSTYASNFTKFHFGDVKGYSLSYVTSFLGQFGLRFKFHYTHFTTALRAWYSSPYASNFTSFVSSLSHYQRASLKNRLDMSKLHDMFMPCK